MTCDNSQVPRGDHVLGQIVRGTTDGCDFGCLEVAGEIAVKDGAFDRRFGFPVMTTTLKVSEWCEPSLFRSRLVVEGSRTFLVDYVELDGELSLNTEFRLCRAQGDEPSSDNSPHSPRT